MSDASKTSLAVWDAPMPVVAGENFSIKAGAKSGTGQRLAGQRIEVCGADGAVVASGVLGDTPFAETAGLCWCALDVPAPAASQVADYTVRLAGSDDAAPTRFSVVAAAKPEHRLAVKVIERDTSEALGGVEIRLGPFRARTDSSGHAEVRVCKGEYQLHLWRTAHVAPPVPLKIDGDVSLDLTMVHVPEEHPDARWVR